MNIITQNAYKLSLSLMCLVMLSFTNCNQSKKNTVKAEINQNKTMPFKLSLAQWSLNKTFNKDGVSPFKFAELSKKMGFEGLEYVNHLYSNQIKALGFDVVIDSLQTLSKQHGIANVLIMVDNEGDLADPDLEKRNLAVENHKKWVDAAAKLGCHSIRVNTFGTNKPELWSKVVVDGLKKLSAYAATKKIHILCENHGWLSSDADRLVAAVKAVNMPNCGTLPDFGNWCVKRQEGERWGACEEEYSDKYKGLALMMPLAKAVSAKSYDFDAQGNETTLDYKRIIDIVKNDKYSGFIGVEYEGKRLSEKEGIMATKALLEKYIN